MTWALTILSLIGNFLNSRKNIKGFYVWTVCNMGWIVYDFTVHNYARVVLGVIQTLFCIYGIINWRAKDERKGEACSRNGKAEKCDKNHKEPLP